MTYYSENNLPVICCWRCGEIAEVDWVDVHGFPDPGPMYLQGRTTCSTPGCVDENGSNASRRPPWRAS